MKNFVILAEERKVKLLCGMNRRFDREALLVRDEIAAGNLGVLRKLTMVAKDHPPPTKEYLQHAPIMYWDSAVHEVDMAIWLLHQKPSLVSLKQGSPGLSSHGFPSMRIDFPSMGNPLSLKSMTNVFKIDLKSILMDSH